jgi:hypothetical protein
MIILRMFCIVVVLGLTACASQSAYKPATDSGTYGYYSTPLGDHRYRVGYNGTSTMSENLVKDYALFRAAELTMQEGKDWFQVVERETRSVEQPARVAVDGNLLMLARSAIERIRRESELKELWQDTEGYDDWQSLLENLVRRLGGAWCRSGAAAVEFG